MLFPKGGVFFLKQLVVTFYSYFTVLLLCPFGKVARKNSSILLPVCMDNMSTGRYPMKKV
jgi:hypothetical protein